MDNHQRNRRRDSSEESEELEQPRVQQLDETACDYCQYSDKTAVIKCLICNRWYCNGKGQNSVGSHAILHLVKARHREIALHPEGKIGDIKLECYSCENKNIFDLGTITVIVDDEENLVVICRQCSPMEEYNKIKWEKDNFAPLIKEKQLDEWMVNQPNESLIANIEKISLDKINQYEEQKNQIPNLKIQFMDKFVKSNCKFKEVQLQYRDGESYYEIFGPLIEKESDFDKKMKESQTQSNVEVRWETASNNKRRRLAFFQFMSREDIDVNMLIGSELKISLAQSAQYNAWSAKGFVTKIMNNEDICLEVYSNEPPPPGKEGKDGYIIEIIWKSTSFTRMKNGLKRFVRRPDCISGQLYDILLGRNTNDLVAKNDMDKYIQDKVSAPNLPDLNVYQLEAVKKALKNSLCLIQGPPGTGKTVTCASIVYNIAKIIEKKRGRDLVLVCAPSNIVADQLAERINKTGIRVIRICAKTREVVSSGVEKLTLHNQLKELALKNQFKDLQKYINLIDEGIELTPEEERKYKRCRDQAENDILMQAQVICTTCIASADPRLKDLSFKYVLIDEATQAIEPECILPMLKGAQMVTLVGDHRQLGPVIACRETAKAGLNKSLFERLVALNIRPTRLQVQYRMHPCLTNFASNTFYEGTLQNGVTISDRFDILKEFPWPDSSKPMFFLNSSGSEQMSQSGTSYLNQSEASSIEKIVTHLIKCGAKASQIGVITPYKGQRIHLQTILQKSNMIHQNVSKEIEIASVDGFQGREKDYIVISCVRSNDNLGIGFLTDPRRLNVTITRAKFGLIIVGNAKVLAKDSLWSSLLSHYKDLELLMDGSFPNLKLCSIQIAQPKKYNPERRNIGMTTLDHDDQRGGEESTIQGEQSLTQGYRKSDFGFNQIPEAQQFSQTRTYQPQISNEGKDIVMIGKILPQQLQDIDI